MSGGQVFKVMTGLAAAGSVIVGGAAARSEGGVSSTFTVGQTVEVTDNLKFSTARDSGYTATTSLGYNYSTQTRASEFGFGLSAGLKGKTGEGFDVNNPTARLSFGRSSRNSQVKLSTSYVQDDADSLGYLSILNDAGELELREVVIGTATRTDIQARLRVETGMAAPFGLSFDASHRQRNFTDTTDPTLYDTRNERASITAKMRVDDRIEFTTTVRASRYEADDAFDTSRDTRSVSVGGEFEVRPNLSATASVSYDWNDYAGLTVAETEGVGFSFGATLARRNGTLSARASTSVISTGRQQSVTVSRQMDLRNGSLYYSLGANKPDGESWQPLASAVYTVEMPRGDAVFRLNQSSSENNDNQNVINTAASASYTQEINAVSSWTTNFQLARTDVVGGSNDSSLVNLGLEYRRDLAQEWNVVLGYKHAMKLRDTAPDVDKNTLSLSIEKKFDWQR